MAADDSDITPSRPSLADAIDLLDLVRSSEEGATLATTTTPASSDPIPAAAEHAHEFVDVGDDAVDLPPSLPPTRAAVPSMPPSMPPIPATARSPVVPEAAAGHERRRKTSFHPPPPRPRPAEPTEAGMSPVVSLLLFAVLAVGALYAIIELPSSGTSGPKPAELELEGGAE